MNIEYAKFSFEIKFEYSLNNNFNSPFIFRSVLGNSLKNMVCLFKDRECKGCELNKVCVYATFFETHIDKNQRVLMGRDRAPHPFIMNYRDGDKNGVILDITLIGKKGIEKLPYIYYALKKGGEWGIFKDRIKYVIKSINIDGKNILKNSSEIDLEFKTELWSDKIYKNMENIDKIKRGDVQFLTPFRYKKGGNFQFQVDYDNFLKNIFRRLKVLSYFYGEYNDFELKFSPKTISISEQRWFDQLYYSGRQKKKMKMGGILGKFSFEGNFSPLEISILKGGEVFNIGKNISFGLGKFNLEFN